jgi:serine/threonine-protein kinase
MTERDSINPFKDDMTGRLMLGRYRILRRLATGGMGVVYLARSEGAAGFVKPVVIKLILPILASNQEFSGMFAREARILANLQHPGIVSVIEFAEELGCYAMILEYVHGFQLGEWKKYLHSLDRTIPTDVVIQVMINVLDALHYAHTLKNYDGERMRIIHRDISPANIMLDCEGHIKLVDFGIAFVSENTEGFKTTNKSFKGKLSYSAPELFSNQQASVRSDIYSVGVTLHELLRGKNEFFFKDHASIVNAVLKHVPTSIHLYRDDAPDEIDEVIWKAVAKKPAHRFKSTADFASELRRITKTPEHKSLTLLAELVKQDFVDEMAEFLGVESLRARERAWRTPSLIPTIGPPRPTKAEKVSQPQLVPPTDTEVVIHDGPPPAPMETVNRTPLERRAAPEPAMSQGGKSVMVLDRTSLMPLLYILAAVLLVGVLGGLAFLFLNKRSSEEKRFLLVQSPSDNDDKGQIDEPPPSTSKPQVAVAKPGADPSPEADPPKEAAAPKENGQNARHQSKRKTKETNGPDMKALTRAFKKRKGKIQSCFEAHPKDLESSPKMSVFFRVTPSGKVSEVDLAPKELSGTALGKCLTKVSKATTFPPQHEAISFRIPLSASKVKK